MVSDRAFIFHIHVYISWGKALSLVQKSRSSAKVKVKYQGHSFWKKKKKKNAVTGALVFHKHILFFNELHVSVFRLVSF